MNRWNFVSVRIAFGPGLDQTCLLHLSVGEDPAKMVFFLKALIAL